MKKFRQQLSDTTSTLLSLMLLSNNLYVSEPDISALVDYHNGDVRRCINQLNFWAKNPKGSQSALRETCLFENSTCLSHLFSKMIGLGSIRPRKNRTIELWPLAKKNEVIFIPTNWNLLDVCKNIPENQTKMRIFLSDACCDPMDMYHSNYLEYFCDEIPNEIGVEISLQSEPAEQNAGLKQCQIAMLSCIYAADIISMADMFVTQSLSKKVYLWTLRFNFFVLFLFLTLLSTSSRKHKIILYWKVSDLNGRCVSLSKKDIASQLIVGSIHMGFKISKVDTNATNYDIPMKFPKERPRYVLVKDICKCKKKIAIKN